MSRDLCTISPFPGRKEKKCNIFMTSMHVPEKVELESLGTELESQQRHLTPNAFSSFKIFRKLKNTQLKKSNFGYKATSTNKSFHSIHNIELFLYFYINCSFSLLWWSYSISGLSSTLPFSNFTIICHAGKRALGRPQVLQIYGNPKMIHEPSYPTTQIDDRMIISQIAVKSKNILSKAERGRPKADRAKRL